MKNPFVILVILVGVIAAGLYLSRHGGPPVPSAAETASYPTPDPADPLSVLAFLAIDLDGHVYQLLEGRAVERRPGCNTPWNAGLSQFMTAGDMNGDGVKDAIAIFVNQCSGNANYHYLGVVLRSADGKGRPTNTLPLGDRIMVERFEYRDGGIDVRFLERPSGIPGTTAPSVVRSIRGTVYGSVLGAHEAAAGTGR